MYNKWLFFTFKHKDLGFTFLNSLYRVGNYVQGQEQLKLAPKARKAQDLYSTLSCCR